jgi:hypothetical protein
MTGFVKFCAVPDAGFTVLPVKVISGELVISVP